MNKKIGRLSVRLSTAKSAAVLFTVRSAVLYGSVEALL
jgi:hypothetical protein